MFRYIFDLWILLGLITEHFIVSDAPVISHCVNKWLCYKDNGYHVVYSMPSLLHLVLLLCKSSPLSESMHQSLSILACPKQMVQLWWSTSASIIISARWDRQGEQNQISREERDGNERSVEKCEGQRGRHRDGAASWSTHSWRCPAEGAGWPQGSFPHRCCPHSYSAGCRSASPDANNSHWCSGTCTLCMGREEGGGRGDVEREKTFLRVWVSVQKQLLKEQFSHKWELSLYICPLILMESDRKFWDPQPTSGVHS